MGNTPPSAAPTQEQADVKFLGDRFPFGDAELEHLYAAYLRRFSTNTSSSISSTTVITNDDDDATARTDDFLCEWSSQCSSSSSSGRLSSDQYQKPAATAKLMKRIHRENILPNNFGNALYRACFCCVDDRKRPVVVVNSNDDGRPPVDEYTRKASLEKFFQGLSNCSGRRGARAALTALFETQSEMDGGSVRRRDSTEDGGIFRVSARALVETGYRIALATAYIQNNNNANNKNQDEEDDTEMIQNYLPMEGDDDDDCDDLAAFAQSVVEKGRRRRQRSGMPGCMSTECPFLSQGLVELEDILEWSDAVAPMFASVLPTFFHYILFPATPFPGSRTAFALPSLDDASSFFSSSSSVAKSSSSSPRLFVLASLSSALSSGWYHRLYTSAADGLSFNRLQNALLGYGGPTVLLVASTSGGIFGAFTASAWKESKDFYGNTDCFLYALSPRTAVYRPTGSGRNFMYCNSTARSKGYDQQAHGIGFGGTVTEPRLFLAENLDDCIAASQDLTFENGTLLPPIESSGRQEHRKYFDIESLEVWGCGGSEAVEAALQARKESRAVTDEAIRRARKVDKAQFLDDFRAGTFASKAFKHRQEADGRANTDMDERCQDKDKVYEYAK